MASELPILLVRGTSKGRRVRLRKKKGGRVEQRGENRGPHGPCPALITDTREKQRPHIKGSSKGLNGKPAVSQRGGRLSGLWAKSKQSLLSI